MERVSRFLGDGFRFDRRLVPGRRRAPSLRPKPGGEVARRTRRKGTGTVTRWVLGILAAALAFGAAAAVWLAGSGLDQPIAFNHRLHLETVGLECSDCHHYALTGVRATIPNIETCGGCHQEAATDSPEEARLVESIQAEEPIRWKKVYRVPDHVYFSHRRHAALGEISCATCHGEVAARERPLTSPLVKVTMDGCMGCHDQRGVSNDCILCHR